MEVNDQPYALTTLQPKKIPRVELGCAETSGCFLVKV